MRHLNGLKVVEMAGHLPHQFDMQQ